jgi:hypothetical protein
MDCFRPNISPPCDATVESKPRFPGNSQSLGETVAQPVVAGEYDDIHKAEEVRLKLLKVQQDYLIDLEDAVVAFRDEQGKGQAEPDSKLYGVQCGVWGILMSGSGLHYCIV